MADVSNIDLIGVNVSKAQLEHAAQIADVITGDKVQKKLNVVGATLTPNQDGTETLTITGGGGGGTIDTAMSDSSENAVQNKVIKAYVDNAKQRLLKTFELINDYGILLEFVPSETELLNNGIMSSNYNFTCYSADGIKRGSPYLIVERDAYGTTLHISGITNNNIFASFYVDLTDFNTITFNGKTGASGGNPSNYCAGIVANANKLTGITLDTNPEIVKYTPFTTDYSNITIDISDLEGSYFVGFNGFQSGWDTQCKSIILS